MLIILGTLKKLTFPVGFKPVLSSSIVWDITIKIFDQQMTSNRTAMFKLTNHWIVTNVTCIHSLKEIACDVNTLRLVAM